MRCPFPSRPKHQTPLADLGYAPPPQVAMPTEVDSINRGVKAPPWDPEAPFSAASAPSCAMKVSPFQYPPVIEAMWPTATSSAKDAALGFIEIYNAVRATSVPNYLGAKIKLPFQMNCDLWDAALHDYHNADVATFLRYGWPGSYTANTTPTPSVSNHPSALAYLPHADTFIEKEVRLGAMLGPFKELPFTTGFKQANS